MSHMIVSPEGAPAEILLESTDHAEIARALEAVGIRYERWSADVDLPPGADQGAILAAYKRDIDRLMVSEGYQSVDVVRLVPDAADPEGYAAKAAAARTKFLSEHTHSEDEVRFFVEGAGIFYLHLDGRVFMVRCERGDLISVPDGVTHWFDMGTRPYFCAIRLFTNPDGWVANFTGSDLASSFPTFDALAQRTGFCNDVPA